MDRTLACGAGNRGSIPRECTNKNTDPGQCFYLVSLTCKFSKSCGRMYTYMSNKKIWKTILQGIFLLVIISVALYFGHIARENESIRSVIGNYGYIGIFIVSIISGFNFVVPIPAASFLPLFLESGLNYWTTLVIISLGMTTADSFAYFLGNLGTKMVSTPFAKKLERKIKIIHEKYNWAPLIILFLFAAFAPLPNEVLLVPFAFLRYRFVYLIPILFAGNMLFNFLFSKGILNIFMIF